MSVDLVKPEFVAGNEKRFFEFISRLNGKDKIALISHADLDGIAAAKVANKVINADYLMLKEYSEVDESLVADLNSKKVKFVIFTDINLSNKEIVEGISKFAELIIIDHHKLDYDYNSNSVVYINAQGFSAGYICYYLFSKIQKVEEYDWLVACSCVSDWLPIKPAAWLGNVFEKYDDKLIIEGEGVRKRGKFWDLQYNISLTLIYFRNYISKAYSLIEGGFDIMNKIKPYSEPVQKELDEVVSGFNSNKRNIPGGYYLEINSKFKICELAINELSFKENKKTLIFIYPERDMIKVSARRQDGTVNLPEMMKKITEGFENSTAGGHVKAAGAVFPAKYLTEFKKRLRVA